MQERSSKARIAKNKRAVKKTSRSSTVRREEDKKPCGLCETLPGDAMHKSKRHIWYHQYTAEYDDEAHRTAV